MLLAVTGGTGFLGRHLVPALVAAGHRVRVLSRREVTLPPGAEQVRGDLEDTKAVAHLLAGTECLVHLACLGVQSRDREWGAMLRVNVEAPVRLVEVAARACVASAIAVGTCLEYQGFGKLPDAPWRKGEDPRCDESSLLESADPYGATKAAGGVALRARARELGLPLLYLRLASLYGAGDDEAKLLPSAARAAVARRPFEMTGGAQVREWLHVDDAVAALLAAVAHPPGLAGDVLNVGTGSGVPLAHVVASLFQLSGTPPELLKAGARPYRRGEPHQLVMRADRARERLGLQPRRQLEDGLAELVAEAGGEARR